MSTKRYGSSPVTKAQAVTDFTFQGGGEYITDTAAHLGKWGAILALSAAVATLVSTNNNNQSGYIVGSLSGVPIPAGTVLYGFFTSITLASGKVIAYNAP